LSRRFGSVAPQTIKEDLVILHIFYDGTTIGLKIFVTLLPKNWLAETPQTLAWRRLGRQPAERERISGINWNVILRKNSRLDSS